MIEYKYEKILAKLLFILYQFGSDWKRDEYGFRPEFSQSGPKRK